MFQAFSALEALAIDIANNFGLDKLVYDERLTWFYLNEERLMDMIDQAETPALFYAGVSAYQDLKAGKASGYPISCDATSQGLQLLACLTGDRKAAELSNVIDTGTRKNAYTEIHEHMCATVGATTPITYADCKKAIMTSLYSSEAVPKRIFGTGALLDVFYQTMVEMAPGAWECNSAFLDMWRDDVSEYGWVLPDNFHVNVKVTKQEQFPVSFFDDFVVVSKTVVAPKKRGRSLGANLTQSVDGMVAREMVRRCDFDPDTVAYAQLVLEEHTPNSNIPECTEGEDANVDMVVKLWGHYVDSGFLSMRILNYITDRSAHYVDTAVLLEAIKELPARPFKVLTVHDCFRALPRYMNELRTQYNIILRDIARSELLSYILSQYLGEKIAVSKLDPEMWRDIEGSNYSLT